MKLIRCTVNNFGSYKDLTLQLNQQGLALIYGKTGSGKSTIPDMVCWTLFGVTAKGGSVDDVRSWTNLDEVTSGELEVELPDGSITIVRERGSRPNENDLYWIEENKEDDSKKRGKDLADTQKLLSARLGVDVDLYLSACYFSEFSSVGSFFMAKASDRRAVLEKIAVLDLPTKLAEKSSAARKKLKEEITSIAPRISNLEGQLKQLNTSMTSCEEQSDSWDKRQTDTIASLLAEFENFEAIKASKIHALTTKYNAFEAQTAQQLAALKSSLASDEELDSKINELETKTTCPTCKAPSISANTKIKALLHKKAKNSDALRKITELSTSENPYKSHIEAVKDQTNQYEALAWKESNKNNPFEDQLTGLLLSIQGVNESLTQDKETLRVATAKHASLDRLYDLSTTLRGELIRKAVQGIQDDTNRYIRSYFEGEISVEFLLDGDKINVEIQKSGYPCSYRQLSKGQRGLLKLAFVVSVMQASSNKAGIHFSNLFFDEALDGLDAELKVKAFDLFQELSQDHESIMLIDHSPEFHQLFSTRYHVDLVGDNSQIEIENE